MPFTLWPSARVTGKRCSGSVEKKFSFRRRRVRSFDKAFVVFPQRKKLRSLTLYRRARTHFSRRTSIRVARRGTGQLEKIPFTHWERKRERERRETKIKSSNAGSCLASDARGKGGKKIYQKLRDRTKVCKFLSRGHRNGGPTASKFPSGDFWRLVQKFDGIKRFSPSLFHESRRIVENTRNRD